MMKEIESLYVNDTWELSELPKRRRPLDANGSLRRKKDLKMLLCVTRPD